MTEEIQYSIPDECITCNPGVIYEKLDNLKAAQAETHAAVKELSQEVQALKEARAASAVTASWVDRGITALIGAIVGGVVASAGAIAATVKAHIP